MKKPSPWAMGAALFLVLSVAGAAAQSISNAPLPPFTATQNGSVKAPGSVVGNFLGDDGNFHTAIGSGTVTSTTPGGGLVSSTTAACSQTPITISGTLSAAECVDPRTTTTETITDSDRGKLITGNNTAAQAYSLAQAGASSQFVAGWYADISNINLPSNPAGIITITPVTSTINGLTSYKIYPGMSGRLISDGTNYRFLVANPGEWQLVNTVTANNTSSNLSDTTSITAQYTEYEIFVEQLVTATTSVSLVMQVQVGGTFQTASYLAAESHGVSGAVSSSSPPTTGVQLGPTGNIISGAPGWNGKYLLSTPSATLTCKIIKGDYSYVFTGPALVTGISSGCYNGGSGAITGEQINVSSGNLVSGVMKIYARN